MRDLIIDIAALEKMAVRHGISPRAVLEIFSEMSEKSLFADQLSDKILKEDPGVCDHKVLVGHVRCGRITEFEGGPVRWYIAELTVHCDGCKKPFAFQGLQTGMSFTQPMVSFDGTEARLPIKPIS